FLAGIAGRFPLLREWGAGKAADNTGFGRWRSPGTCDTRRRYHPWWTALQAPESAPTLPHVRQDGAWRFGLAPIRNEPKPRLPKRKSNMSDVADRVRKIVVEHLNVDAEKVVEKASFIDDLGADSLDQVELVMAFEEEFSVEIPDDAAE